MNPYAILGAVLLWASSVLAAGWWAYGAGKDSEVATQAREDRAVAVASEAAASAAASAISKIEVKNTTVRQTLEKEIREKPVYLDCRSGMPAVGLLNATPGIAPAASAPGNSQLPASSPAH